MTSEHQISFADPAQTCAHEPLAAHPADLVACDYCGHGFRAYRPSQRYCSEPCRRAFERIIARVGSRLHGLIRDGVREILAEHRREG